MNTIKNLLNSGNILGFNYGSFEKYPIETQKLILKLEQEIHAFLLLCINEKDKRIVTRTKNKLIKKYKLNFNYSGFYYRELDSSSKHFKHDYDSIVRLKFQNYLIHIFCDYFLLINDGNELYNVIIYNYLKMSQSHLIKLFVILKICYKLKLPLYVLASHMANSVESVLDIDKVKSIGGLRVSKSFRNFLESNSLNFNTEQLFIIIKKSIMKWEKNNSDWADRMLFKNDNWIIIRKYSYSSSSGSYAGIFDMGIANSGCYFPSRHRFYRKKIPILKKNKNNAANYDSVLYYLSSDIKFGNIIENYVRESLGYPLIGEGEWLSEVLVLKLVRDMCICEVVHQWSPAWLGRQRFDIGIPYLNIANEYNGKQHYEPIDFFGGIDGFENTKKRDSLKKKLSKINGVMLIEIKYDLPIKDIVLLLKNLFSIKGILSKKYQKMGCD